MQPPDVCNLGKQPDMSTLFPTRLVCSCLLLRLECNCLLLNWVSLCPFARSLGAAPIPESMQLPVPRIFVSCFDGFRTCCCVDTHCLCGNTCWLHVHTTNIAWCCKQVDAAGSQLQTIAEYYLETRSWWCRRQTQTSQIRRSFSRTKSSRIQQAMDRASSQSFTEQHKRLGQQHQQAQADAAASQANANRPARGIPPGTLTSVIEDPAETLIDTAPAQARQQAPTGTYAGATAAPVNGSAGLQRGSGSSHGSGKRVSPKPMHYGMSEHSVPLPVLHSPFAAVSAAPAQKADVLESVDANLQSLQQEL